MNQLSTASLTFLIRQHGALLFQLGYTLIF